MTYYFWRAQTSKTNVPPNFPGFWNSPEGQTEIKQTARGSEDWKAVTPQFITAAAEFIPLIADKYLLLS